MNLLIENDGTYEIIVTNTNTNTNFRLQLLEKLKIINTVFILPVLDNGLFFMFGSDNMK